MGCSRDSIRRNIESSGSISVMAIRSLGQLPGVPISRCSTKLLALTSLIGDSDKTLPPSISTGVRYSRRRTPFRVEAPHSDSWVNDETQSTATNFNPHSHK